MNWADKSQAKRRQYWPAVEHFFSTLPPPLFQQAVLLKNNLATFFSATGQVGDILCRERDHPLLYWHFWLLDDLGYPDNPARVALEQHLFLGMAFTFAAVYTRESILDEATNVDQVFTFLDHALARQADFYLGQLFPVESPWWGYYRAAWHDFSAAALLTAERRPMVNQTSGSYIHLLPAKLAFTKISLAAVAVRAGRAELWPQLEPMLDRLNAVFQLLREISTLRRDLTQRRTSYPILKTLELAGLDPHQPLSPERLLGALVLTGAVTQVCQEGLSWLAQGQAAAQVLNLPTFTAYCAVLETWLLEVRDLFTLKPKTAPPVAPQHQTPLFAPALDPLPQVIDMAQGYLLSDPTFRESWEVQRRGLFGTSAMTAKAFPMGLVVEILCQHGHAMSSPINDIFQTLQSTGFRYYDHPHLPPDTDDLGLLLRLYPYSSQTERQRAILQTPLRWLEGNLGESGQIPVWLTRFEAPDKMDYPFVALWGQHCAAVEANLLLGLLAYDGQGYRDLIKKAARCWCDRLLSQGLSAIHHYGPLYSWWIAFELIAKLKAAYVPAIPGQARNPHRQAGAARPADQQDAAGAELHAKLDQVTLLLVKHLAGEAQRFHITPQDAAFLTLTCYSSGWPESIPSLFKADWITLLCKSQRYDGSWAAEPLYGTPTRGELAAWYSSRTVTTAFCFHALKTYRIYSPPTPKPYKFAGIRGFGDKIK
jgi:hypothetical protein